MRHKSPQLGEGDEYDLVPDDGEPVYNLQEREGRKIVSWRLACFERLGFGPTAAVALAMRRDIDRHDVEVLLAKGARLDEIVAIFL